MKPVAWAVRTGKGYVYLPSGSPPGRRERAERIVELSQGIGGVWSVVPLVPGDVIDRLEATITALTEDIESYRADARDYDVGWEVGYQRGKTDAESAP